MSIEHLELWAIGLVNIGLILAYGYVKIRDLLKHRSRPVRRKRKVVSGHSKSSVQEQHKDDLRSHAANN